MGFTADQTAEILKALDRMCEPVTVRSRRRRRLPTEATTVRLQVAATGISADWVAVEVKDYSLRGIGFVLARPLAPGLRLMLEVPLPSGRLKHIGCIVTDCRPLDGAVWHIATEFGVRPEPRLAG